MKTESKRFRVGRRKLVGLEGALKIVQGMPETAKIINEMEVERYVTITDSDGTSSTIRRIR